MRTILRTALVDHLGGGDLGGAELQADQLVVLLRGLRRPNAAVPSALGGRLGGGDRLGSGFRHGSARPRLEPSAATIAGAAAAAGSCSDCGMGRAAGAYPVSTGGGATAPTSCGVGSETGGTLRAPGDGIGGGDRRERRQSGLRNACDRWDGDLAGRDGRRLRPANRQARAPGRRGGAGAVAGRGRGHRRGAGGGEARGSGVNGGARGAGDTGVTAGTRDAAVLPPASACAGR